MIGLQLVACVLVLSAVVVFPVTTLAQTLTAGQRDAVVDLVLGGAHDDIDPSMYPPPLGSEIKQYLARSRAYRSTRRSASNRDGVAKMAHGTNINLERRLAAALRTRARRNSRWNTWTRYDPATNGKAFRIALKERRCSRINTSAHPDGPFREVLPLLAAHLWLCTAEFAHRDVDYARRAKDADEDDIAVAVKSSSLIIRTAAEGLQARGRCYSASAMGH
jgi:hypothetical protein